MRAWRWCVLGGLLSGLVGCSTADLIGSAINQGGSGGNGAVVTALSSTWTVGSMSGTGIGAVAVPAATNLRWTFSSNGTWALTGTQPLTLSGAPRSYNETGTWRVVSASLATIGLTVTQTAGVAVPTESQAEVAATYSQNSSNDLVIFTSALAPGNIRYVMAR